jgi:hypothetical protein
MGAQRFTRWLKANVDGVDALTFSLALARYLACVAWADVIVRAIRDEEAKENWKTFSSSAVLMALSALQSGAEIREFASLRGAAVEMRGLVHDAARQAELREQRAAERDRESAAQQERILRLTKWLVALATLTLAAAIVTLAVTIAA